jgi:DNA helicase-2/ATP-dependent DNA helicase PcrA
MKLSHILDGLNDSQKRAVTTTEGPVLIVAGPGTGKTLTIVHRIAYLVQQGVAPENILAVTFTNRAAKEMLDRTNRILGTGSRRMFIGTFHLLGLRILRDALPDGFTVCDRAEQINLLRTLSKNSGRKVREIADRISRAKSFIEDLDDEIKDIYEKYQTELDRNSAFDFDDLILRPIEMLSDNDLSEKYKKRFRYIIVDEYQDINPAQFRLLRLLSDSSGNVCAVGDSDQAIYAFRGADIENFLNFERDFEGAAKLFLTENYRSTGIILGASNGLIKNNIKRIDREINAVREKGSCINIISAPDERAEGEVIVREIEKRVGGTSHYQMMQTYTDRDFTDESYCFSDFAVIFRTNAQARTIEEAFVKSGIPYQVIGKSRPSETNAIKDTISYLRAIINPEDNINLRRVLALSSTGLGNADLSEISLYAEDKGLSLYEALQVLANQGDRNKRKFLDMMEKFMNLSSELPPDEFIRKVVEESGIRSYYKNDEGSFDLLENLAASYQGLDPSDALIRITDEAGLLSPADSFDPKADVVTIMTLHMAKGLEFRVVFITGVEDGLIPYTIRKDESDIEEERRLFYVGMTRARDELFLLHARNRFLYGERLSPSPSPFLGEIPEEFIQRIVMPDRVKKQKQDSQMGLF